MNNETKAALNALLQAPIFDQASFEALCERCVIFLIALRLHQHPSYSKPSAKPVRLEKRAATIIAAHVVGYSCVSVATFHAQFLHSQPEILVCVFFFLAKRFSIIV